MKTSFCGSRSLEIKSIKDWNKIFIKIHFVTEDFMKCSEVIIKIKNIFCDKTSYPYNYSREISITNIGSLRPEKMEQFQIIAIFSKLERSLNCKLPGCIKSSYILLIYITQEVFFFIKKVGREDIHTLESRFFTSWQSTFLLQYFSDCYQIKKFKFFCDCYIVNL